MHFNLSGPDELMATNLLLYKFMEGFEIIVILMEIYH